MSDPYFEMEDIWARYLAGDRSKTSIDVLDLLTRQGIGLRQKDGELRQVTSSKPTSIPHGFVIGLRYVKRDGSLTEDHFAVEAGQKIVEPHYRGTLERKWPEYRGTHKQQVVFALVDEDLKAPPTDISSIWWDPTRFSPQKGS